jgi:hypothetical protein
MVVICALFTLGLGLDVWYGTLQTRNNLLAVWSAEPSSTQSLLQQKVIYSMPSFANTTDTASLDVVAILIAHPRSLSQTQHAQVRSLQ